MAATLRYSCDSDKEIAIQNTIVEMCEVCAEFGYKDEQMDRAVRSLIYLMHDKGMLRIFGKPKLVKSDRWRPGE